MIAGRFAFQGLSEYLTWQKIKRLDYSFPDGFDEEAKDLVRTRRYIEKFYGMRSQLQKISLRIQVRKTDPAACPQSLMQETRQNCRVDTHC